MSLIKLATFLGHSYRTLSPKERKALMASDERSKKYDKYTTGIIGALGGAAGGVIGHEVARENLHTKYNPRIYPRVAAKFKNLNKIKAGGAALGGAVLGATILGGLQHLETNALRNTRKDRMHNPDRKWIVGEDWMKKQVHKMKTDNE